MKPTIGSLCAGYGGLDLAVSEFFDVETVWTCEILSVHFGGFQ